VLHPPFCSPPQPPLFFFFFSRTTSTLTPFQIPSITSEPCPLFPSSTLVHSQQQKINQHNPSKP